MNYTELSGMAQTFLEKLPRVLEILTQIITIAVLAIIVLTVAGVAILCFGELTGRNGSYAKQRPSASSEIWGQWGGCQTPTEQSHNAPTPCPLAFGDSAQMASGKTQIHPRSKRTISKILDL